MARASPHGRFADHSATSGYPLLDGKDVIEPGQSVVGLNSEPTVELISVPSAQGDRAALTAVDGNGICRTRSARTGPIDQLGLHGIESVISSFDHEIVRAEVAQPDKERADAQKAVA